MYISSKYDISLFNTNIFLYTTLFFNFPSLISIFIHKLHTEAPMFQAVGGMVASFFLGFHRLRFPPCFFFWGGGRGGRVGKWNIYSKFFGYYGYPKMKVCCGGNSHACLQFRHSTNSICWGDVTSAFERGVVQRYCSMKSKITVWYWYITFDRCFSYVTGWFAASMLKFSDSWWFVSQSHFRTNLGHIAGLRNAGHFNPAVGLAQVAHT